MLHIPISAIDNLNMPVKMITLFLCWEKSTNCQFQPNQLQSSVQDIDFELENLVPRSDSELETLWNYLCWVPFSYELQISTQLLFTI